MADERRSISFVVEQDLCTCCGTCEGLCPESAIKMTESPGGLLLPRIDTGKCTECGVCTDVCPGWKVERIWPENSDSYEGQVISVYLAHAADPELRLEAQSAGAVTALLQHLLAKGEIDRALVTEMPKDGSLRSQSFLAHAPDEVKRACGSKYFPTGSNAVLSAVQKDDKIAVVGLGCHIHGLRRAEMNRPARLGDVQIAIGLICEGMLGYGAMDYLVKKSGMPRKEVRALRFKSKKLGGWPGDTLVETSSEDRRLDSSHRFSCKPGFKLPRCMLCWDKLNVAADIVAGDPWGIRDDKLGWNVILTRTDRGERIVQQAINEGVIVVEPISVERVIRGQNIDGRRRQTSAGHAVWTAMGKVPPEFAMTLDRPGNKLVEVCRQDLALALKQVHSATSAGAMRVGRRRIRRAEFKEWYRIREWPVRLRRRLRQWRKRIAS